MYDGGDGLTVQPTTPVSTSFPGSPSKGSINRSIRSFGLGSERIDGGSAPSTPRRVKPGPLKTATIDGGGEASIQPAIADDPAVSTSTGGYSPRAVRSRGRGRGTDVTKGRGQGGPAPRLSNGGRTGRGGAAAGAGTVVASGDVTAAPTQIATTKANAAAAKAAVPTKTIELNPTDV